MLDVDHPGQLLEGGALAGVLVQQGAYGVRDLAATAVPDRDVDEQPVHFAGGLGCRLEPRGHRRGQQVERTHRMQPPASLLREGLDGVSDDGEQGLELLGGTVQVVGREQPQRDHLDADVLAPAQQRLDVRGAGPVALRSVGSDSLGPPAVAVEHHPDVLGEPFARKAAGDSCLVRRVEHPAQSSFPVRHARDCTAGRWVVITNSFCDKGFKSAGYLWRCGSRPTSTQARLRERTSRLGECP